MGGGHKESRKWAKMLKRLWAIIQRNRNGYPFLRLFCGQIIRDFALIRVIRGQPQVQGSLRDEFDRVDGDAATARTRVLSRNGEFQEAIAGRGEGDVAHDDFDEIGAGTIEIDALIAGGGHAGCVGAEAQAHDATVVGALKADAERIGAGI